MELYTMNKLMTSALDTFKTNSDFEEYKIFASVLDRIITTQHSYDDFSLETIEEALTEIINIHGGDCDFNFEFDGNEYRIIEDDAIWNIYVDSIKDIVQDCYELNLDKIPSFIAVTIDWQQTAQNALTDGYGHTFSSYDGSEEEVNGWWIFRTN
jgi:hypothetical protein